MVLVAAVCCLNHVSNYDWLIDWLIVVGGSRLTAAKLNDCIALAHKRATFVSSLIESALASVEQLSVTDSDCKNWLLLPVDWSSLVFLPSGLLMDHPRTLSFNWPCSSSSHWWCHASMGAHRHGQGALAVPGNVEKCFDVAKKSPIHCQ